MIGTVNSDAGTQPSAKEPFSFSLPHSKFKTGACPEPSVALQAKKMFGAALGSPKSWLLPTLKSGSPIPRSAMTESVNPGPSPMSGR